MLFIGCNSSYIISFLMQSSGEKIPLEPWLHLEALNAASAGQGAAGTVPTSGMVCRPLP